MSLKISMSLTIAVGLGLSACSGSVKRVDLSKMDGATIDQFLIVDCLLPGRVRQLGTRLTYLGPRRAVRTSGSDCGIRGGEYVAADRANYATSLKIWQPLAEAGDLKAQTYVGEIYEKGLGISPDYQKAAGWYQKAAAQGYDRAKMNLGSLYERGLGVAQNPVQALNLYRDASGLGKNQLEFVSAEQRAQRIAQTVELAQSRRSLQGTQARVSQLQQEIDQLRTETNRLRQLPPTVETRTVTRTVKDPEQERIIQQLNREVAGLRAQSNQTQRQMTRTSADNVKTRALQAQNARLKAELAKKRAEVARRQAQLAQQAKQAQPQRPLTRSVSNTTETQRQIAAIEKKIVAKQQEVAQQTQQVVAVNNEAPVRAVKSVSDKKSLRGVNFGKYYAVLIGNNNYTNASNLQTPVNDAKTVGSILKRKYGFRTVVLENASRARTLAALNSLRKKLTPKDNLVIYYAGHGELKGSRGFWLPADASATDQSTWISNEQITNFIESMSAKHVLVVADSCYSGTLSRRSIPRPVVDAGSRTRDWFNTVSKTKVRVVMSSGGVKPVLDSGGGRHSVFASAFLNVLRSGNSVVEGATMYQALRNQVKRSSSALGVKQSPLYAPIQYAGHEAGDFIFLQGGRVAALDLNQEPDDENGLDIKSVAWRESDLGSVV